MKRYPGKFEGCADQRLGQALYNVTLNGGCSEEFGDVETFGWYGLIESRNKKTVYIVEEDSQGFFNYAKYERIAGYDAWDMVQEDYRDACDNAE